MELYKSRVERKPTSTPKEEVAMYTVSNVLGKGKVDAPHAHGHVYTGVVDRADPRERTRPGDVALSSQLGYIVSSKTPVHT